MISSEPSTRRTSSRLPERHHLTGLVGDVEVADILQLPAMIGLGLHPDLEALVELVEQVDVGRSQIGLQRLGDIVDRDPERLRHRSIDIQVELRAVGAEGGKTDAQKTRPVLRGAENLLHRLLQLAEPGSGAIFDDHLESKGVSQARDRRGRQHGNLRVPNRQKFFLQLGEKIRLGKPGRTLVPVLIHDEGRDDVGKLGRIERRIAADGHPAFDARDIFEHGVDVGRQLAHPRLRGAGGKPRRDNAVSLVFQRHEGGRIDRKGGCRQADDDEENTNHRPRALHHPAHDADVAFLHRAVDSIEAPIKPVHLSILGHRPQIQRALRRLQRQRIDGADDRRGRNHQRKLAKHLPRDPRQKRRRQKHRGQHQGDSQHRPGQLAHRLDRRILGSQTLLDIAGGVLDDDDGVVDHDADGQDQGEERHQIHREAEQAPWPQTRR